MGLDPLTREPPASPQSAVPHSARLREVALLFTKLGFIAFGGPAAHLSLMEDEVVTRRHWIDRQHFLDLVAAVSFLPGPNSTEVAINLGLIRAGWLGMFVSGACFITPAMLVILPIAWAYVTYQRLPQVRGIMFGINAAVVAIVAVACLRFGKAAVKDAFTTVVFLAAVGAEIALRQFHVGEPELIVLAAAGLAGALRHGRPRLPTATAPLLTMIGLSAPQTVESWSGFVRLALYFLKIGATLFGSGYVLVTYLQSGLVEQYHWLTSRQLLDAVSVGQVTPGPLLTTATFIGFLRGHDLLGTTWGGMLGGVVATIAIFLPAFFFVAILGVILPRIRGNPMVRGALDGMNAAVVALILVVTLQLGKAALFPLGWANVTVALATLVALLAWRVNATWMILFGAVAGLIASVFA